MNRNVVISTMIAGGVLSVNSLLAGDGEKPNYIVIMCDDLGYSDVGFNGSTEIPTPNIDRIANEGVRFAAGYTTYSVSSPSRAGFMTGRYPQRFGYERNPQYRPNNPNMGLPQNERTIAEALAESGYTSGIIGKWHLGAHKSNHPLNRGFNEFFGHLGGGHKYFPKDYIYPDSYAINEEGKSYRTLIMRGHDHVKSEKYLTDEFSDEAVSFVSRYKDNPFFLFLSYNAPHTPMEATPEYLSRFPNIENKRRKTYAAMVSAVDDGVGRLLDKIDELGIGENTVIFFLSDNGGPEHSNSSDNGELRDGKSSIYEGGFRVPFAMKWGAKIKSPIVYDNPISSLDIFATIAAHSDVKIDSEKPLDGVDLLPYLLEEKTGVPHEVIYLRKFDQKAFAVRYNDYKLVIRDDVKELYNISTDIGETVNLIEENPKMYKKIDNLREEWNSHLIDPVFLGLRHGRADNKAKNKDQNKKQK